MNLLGDMQPRASDVPVEVLQMEIELDRQRRRVERLIKNGAPQRDLDRALRDMQRTRTAVDTIDR